MTYIALTIGPIYKTLAHAKKPKELFASSYIFSYIMREIIYDFKEREFITPYIKDATIFDKNSEVGLFHDRFIFQSKEGDIEILEESIISVCEDIATKFSIKFSQVRDYLQINYFEKELNDGANPILELTPYLDTQELFFSTTQDETFRTTLKREKGDKDNFLTDAKSIVDDLEKLSHNNYYCVVHADGDKMSKTIEDVSNIEKVSKSLFEYCKNANKLIKAYGGQTIFAGGDDLLFFAPTLSKQKDKTIFDLCEEIAKDFSSKIPTSTLSFGVSINYLKFPLYEALENSRELLFSQAKIENKNSEKNNIAFMVTKHSGQSFSTVIYKGDREVYEKFLTLTASIKSGEDVNNFLHSIHHKIDTYKTTIKKIIDNKQRLQNFFDNYFNEAEHDQYKPFFKGLIEFMSASKDINQVYAALRFVKFIRGDKQ